MDQWIDEAVRNTSAVAGTFNVWDVLVALFLSTFLSLLLAWTYRVSHRGLSYSTSFVHTIVIMSVTVAVIMLIIGSNLARAFALVGALSIIRFRTAIKDPRDVGFIFMGMAVGMACGVRLPLIAILFTLFACPLAYLLYRFDVGAMPSSEVLLKVHLPAERDPENTFAAVFARFLREHTLLSLETLQGGALAELVYAVQFKKGADPRAFVDAMRSANDGQRVVVLTGAQNVSV